MLSIAKKAVLLLIFMTMGFTLLQASSREISTVQESPPFRPNHDPRLTSSRFTQTEDLRIIEESSFVALLPTDEEVLRNDQFILYLNYETLAMKVKNRSTGYVWNTVIDEVDAGTFNGFLSSSIGFEYININQSHNIRQNVGISDTEFIADVKIENQQIVIEFDIGGFCTSRQCSRFYPEYLLGNPSYDLDRMISLGFINLDIQFSLIVELTEEGIRAHIPYQSIQQNNIENIVLSSLIVFPGLGATYKEDIPGYMVIPDGIGALMRYQENPGRFVAVYEERFYGRNQGITTGRASVTNEALMMPIFGAVHGVHQHAFVAIIEEGDINARLVAMRSGASNIPYNLIFVKYDLNQVYRQSFTSDGLGGVLQIHASSSSDITVRYNFMSEKEADYVGIALNYQRFLQSQGVLQNLVNQATDIPLFTQYFMADSRARFIGKETIVMTNADAVLSSVQQLESRGINHQHIALTGWNSGGYSGHLPASLNFERALASNREFRRLFESLDSYELYLVNNYIYASEQTQRINYRRDVAAGVNRFRLERTCPVCVYQETYTLYPTASKRLALGDLNDYQSWGVNVLFESMANTLFSYHQQQQTFTRADGLNHYLEIMSLYEGHAGYQTPFAYSWGYTDRFFETPLFNSQLKTFDDVIPLLTIVLSGQMTLFSPFLNFNSLGTSQLLRLIDFNIYPAYMFTDERSSQLRGSDQESLFATQFSAWESTVIDEYNFINEALRHVIGARIIARTVIAPGLVRTAYDNGVSIIVNYSHEDQIYEGQTIFKESYRVNGVRP